MIVVLIVTSYRLQYLQTSLQRGALFLLLYYVVVLCRASTVVAEPLLVQHFLLLKWWIIAVVKEAAEALLLRVSQDRVLLLTVLASVFFEATCGPTKKKN